MTSTPDSGWTDGNGAHHPDSPPPGYWIASDGRWYPPELAPQQATPPPAPEVTPPTYAAPDPIAAPDPAASWAAPTSGPPPMTAPGMTPPGGPGGAPAPGFQPFEPSNAGGDDNGKRKLIFGAVAALLAIVVIGGVVVAVGGGDDDDGETIAADAGTDATGDDDTGTDPSEADDTATTVITEPPVQDTTPDEPETSDTTAPPSATGELEPASISCQRIPESDYVLLEFTNNTGVMSNFSFTVGFFDDAGTRLADESAYFSNVRAGERVIEESYMIEDSGSSCEVIDVDQNDPWYGDEALGDVSECTTGEPDFADDVSGTITATNSTDVNVDYFIELAIVDGDGVRRGTASAFVETVRPGESAPADIFTVVDYAPDRRCEVVAVNRTESE